MYPCWNRGVQCTTRREPNVCKKRSDTLSAHVKDDPAELDRAPLVDGVRHLEHDHQE